MPLGHPSQVAYAAPNWLALLGFGDQMPFNDILRKRHPHKQAHLSRSPFGVHRQSRRRSRPWSCDGLVEAMQNGRLRRRGSKRLWTSPRSTEYTTRNDYKEREHDTQRAVHVQPTT
ncbi:uncharacterized protein SPSK_06709 [Sporothrix schenckii 1099-18]|uniref:Uncharacterized protein n=1 Tax=Sporothrix schenckii 1099-18 TaxID=1397361 RepID=A0A0F2MHU4_SPOSC|nr:uncharacterized protein SPSK_06709 [Sporothrix schenckii 1099-18]KJR89268.1 hypothetical protein SPSK_06709 [Sporothrix schenckii 1099-18]